MAAHAVGSGYGAKHRSAYRAHTAAFVLGAVYGLHQLFVGLHLLGVHTVLGEVFHVDFAECAKAAVHRHKCLFHALYLQACEQAARKMQTCRRRYHGTLALGKDTLVVFGVARLGFALDVRRQGRCAQGKQCLFKFIVRPVVEETQGTSARSGVVDNLGHH